MPRGGGAEAQKMTKCGSASQCVCACLLFFLKLLAYILFCGQASDIGWFFPLHQYNKAKCSQGRIAPANQTGLKVLVGGLQKTGTRTFSRTLYELGYEASYHGEDSIFYLWHGLTAEYWEAPENGGYLIPPIAVVYMITEDRQYDGQILQSNAWQDKWIDRVAECRIDAMAFDGLESIFFETADASPDAKVLVTNWRTYEQWLKSRNDFVFWNWIFILLAVDVHLCTHFLPYNLIFHITEPLLSHPIRKILKSGRPPANQIMAPYQSTWHRHYVNQWGMSHMYGGLGFKLLGVNSSDYYDFYEEIEKRIPSERRLNVDPRKTTYEDICRFLEINPCKKSGKLPNAISVGPHDQDFFPAFGVCFPIYMVLHWINWRVLHWICGRICCRRKQHSS